MDTFECLSKRASVREYLDKAIDKKLLEALVDAGRRAPTARHEEPWEFIVITDKKTLIKLGEAASSGSFIKGAPACVAVFCKDTKYYLEDGCAATENILLAAAGMGLGACWVAGDKKPYAEEVRKMLALPEGFKLISLIPTGWPGEKTQQSKYRELNEVLHWERFGRK